MTTPIPANTTGPVTTATPSDNSTPRVSAPPLSTASAATRAGGSGSADILSGTVDLPPSPSQTPSPSSSRSRSRSRGRVERTARDRTRSRSRSRSQSRSQSPSRSRSRSRSPPRAITTTASPASAVTTAADVVTIPVLASSLHPERPSHFSRRARTPPTRTLAPRPPRARARDPRDVRYDAQQQRRAATGWSVNGRRGGSTGERNGASAWMSMVPSRASTMAPFGSRAETGRLAPDQKADNTRVLKHGHVRHPGITIPRARTDNPHDTLPIAPDACPPPPSASSMALVSRRAATWSPPAPIPPADEENAECHAFMKTSMPRKWTDLSHRMNTMIDHVHSSFSGPLAPISSVIIPFWELFDVPWTDPDTLFSLDAKHNPLVSYRPLDMLLSLGEGLNVNALGAAFSLATPAIRTSLLLRVFAEQACLPTLTIWVPLFIRGGTRTTASLVPPNQRDRASVYVDPIIRMVGDRLRQLRAVVTAPHPPSATWATIEPPVYSVVALETPEHATAGQIAQALAASFCDYVEETGAFRPRSTGFEPARAVMMSTALYGPRFLGKLADDDVARPRFGSLFASKLVSRMFASTGLPGYELFVLSTHKPSGTEDDEKFHVTRVASSPTAPVSAAAPAAATRVKPATLDERKKPFSTTAPASTAAFDSLPPSTSRATT